MPNTACSKQFTLKIVQPIPTLSAYWTLDEAGGGFTPRVDSVTGLQLVPVGLTDVGAPALYSNGMHYSGAFGGVGMDTGGFAVLAHTAGAGFSFFGWFKLNSKGDGGPRAPFMDYITVNGQLLIQVGNNYTPQTIQVENNDDVAGANVTLGAWHFFHCFLDPATNKNGFSIDNGAATILPTAQPNNVSAWGEVQLGMGWASVLGDMLFDEIGIKCNAMLTPAELGYLYNGGAGRTWPL